jgi:glycosyltransferase involved in cell wall biosynthesis
MEHHARRVDQDAGIHYYHAAAAAVGDGMKLPKVSIIIPCYNYKDYVLNTLDSCMGQDYKGEYEVIVVDDASTDNSVMEIRRFYNTYVRLVALGRNVGYSAAKNEGIKRSSGDLITTIDADDMLTSDSLSMRVQEFISNPELLMVHAQAWVIKGPGDMAYWLKRLYKISHDTRTDKIHAQTVMVRRSVHRDYGLYDEKLRSRGDNELWHRLIDAAKIGDRIKFIKHPVAFYRKHDQSMVQYRKRNPSYNLQQTRILEEQKAKRLREGITRDNTLFLKK